MKISSRAQLKSKATGVGPYAINMTYEELQYLSAVLSVTRLGYGSPYKHAAFNLINAITELFDDDFLTEASNVVDLHVSIVDEDCKVLEKFTSNEVCIEV